MLSDQLDIGVLKGKVLSQIIGALKGSDHIKFITTDNHVYIMDHDGECCETVTVEDICGDISDILGGREIILAEKVTSKDDPPPKQNELTPESYTWTFYKIGTNRGVVTIRWFGESNGYYSEEVDFREVLE